ncbi:unnamed protein product [Ectocarpus sp. CCAP 1310/34]|nr:unnamed protein product [Ectocarpus sp. CCAP 1310/34]
MTSDPSLLNRTHLLDSKRGRGTAAALPPHAFVHSPQVRMDVVALMARTVFVIHSTSPSCRWAFFLTAL